MHSSYVLREVARLEVVRDILGHVNIDVTQSVYGQEAGGSEWMLPPKLPVGSGFFAGSFKEAAEFEPAKNWFGCRRQLALAPLVNGFPSGT